MPARQGRETVAEGARSAARRAAQSIARRSAPKGGFGTVGTGASVTPSRVPVPPNAGSPYPARQWAGDYAVNNGGAATDETGSSMGRMTRSGIPRTSGCPNRRLGLDQVVDLSGGDAVTDYLLSYLARCSATAGEPR